jgi:hypothetical protein
MPQQKPLQGTARQKRNNWRLGSGSYSFRGELKGGISLNKRILNKRVRHNSKEALQGADYKKTTKTLRMVDFT